MTEPSPLPPRLRDTRNLADLVRHQRTNDKQLGVGFADGRFSPAKPLGATALYGDLEDDDEDIELAFLNTDRITVTGSGNVTFRLIYIPQDGSEHVTWHPNGGGGLHLTAADWTRDGQTITVPAFDGLASGDVFTCEYAYEMGEENAIALELVGIVAGVFAYPANTLTFTPPAGMQAGDFLVVAARGASAAGGGDLTLDVTTVDPRISRIYAATPPVVEAVFTGFATSSTSDVVTNVVPNPSWLPGAVGVMGVFRGVTAVDTFQAIELAGSTPTVPAAAAVAVTWDGNSAFSFVHADPPTGYTDAGASGLGYSATDISYWFDPDAVTSIAGTFAGQGCLVIGIR